MDYTIKQIIDQAITDLIQCEGEPMDGDRTEYLGKVFLTQLNIRNGNT